MKLKISLLILLFSQMIPLHNNCMFTFGKELPDFTYAILLPYNPIFFMSGVNPSSAQISEADINFYKQANPWHVAAGLGVFATFAGLFSWIYIQNNTIKKLSEQLKEKKQAPQKAISPTDFLDDPKSNMRTTNISTKPLLLHIFCAESWIKHYETEKIPNLEEKLERFAKEQKRSALESDQLKKENMLLNQQIHELKITQKQLETQLNNKSNLEVYRKIAELKHLKQLLVEKENLTQNMQMQINSLTEQIKVLNSEILMKQQEIENEKKKLCQQESISEENDHLKRQLLIKELEIAELEKTNAKYLKWVQAIQHRSYKKDHLIPKERKQLFRSLSGTNLYESPFNAEPTSPRLGRFRVFPPNAYFQDSDSAVPEDTLYKNLSLPATRLQKTTGREIELFKSDKTFSQNPILIIENVEKNQQKELSDDPIFKFALALTKRHLSQ